VLNNRAVHSELVAAAICGGGAVFWVLLRLVRGGGFGDDGLEDRVDDGVVPGCGAVVVVGCCGAEGGGAGVCGDLGEAGCC
jgi:hypothetical protein